MSNNLSAHATLVQIGNKGVILCGKSGAGKSDLAFRLIEDHKAVLVSDDIVLLKAEKNKLFGMAPENLRGLLEVRGVGIARYPFTEETPIDLVVDLLDEDKPIERLPQAIKKITFFGYELPHLEIHAKEASAPQKILLKLRDNLLKQE